MGYRADFTKWKITATGGIYVRSFPVAEQIIIGSGKPQKPGLFTSDLFVQSLLPGDYPVLIKKTGYYEYSKTLSVVAKEVTKLENIFLFKKNIEFAAITDKNNPFATKKQAVPDIKGMVAFALQNNNVVWLKTDGLLYKSNINNPSLDPVKITLTPIKIRSTADYKIILDNKNIFLVANENLLVLDSNTNDLENFYAPAKDAKISPDGQNIIYYDNNNVYISPILDASKKELLYKSSEKITDCLWLNNYYIAVATSEKIIISEIDLRDEINIITINQKTEKIFFDNQTSKLYVLTGKTILSSEKLLP